MVRKQKENHKAVEVDLTPERHGTRYPWAEWFASKKFTLKRGKDYTCRTDTMAKMVQRAAQPLFRGKVRKGYRISFSIADDSNSLTVTVLGPRKSMEE